MARRTQHTVETFFSRIFVRYLRKFHGKWRNLLRMISIMSSYRSYLREENQENKIFTFHYSLCAYLKKQKQIWKILRSVEFRQAPKARSVETRLNFPHFSDFPENRFYSIPVVFMQTFFICYSDINRSLVSQMSD